MGAFGAARISTTSPMSISYTTRAPRRNEAHEVDYLFVDEEEFMRLRDAGEMLEYAQVFDNYYATSRSQVEKHLAEGYDVILEIDWQGARQVRLAWPSAIGIFVLPPSLSGLRERLRGRVLLEIDETILGEHRDVIGEQRIELLHYCLRIRTRLQTN